MIKKCYLSIYLFMCVCQFCNSLMQLEAFGNDVGLLHCAFNSDGLNCV